MKNERGFTLIETMVALVLVVILSASGLYGWQYWQQTQRLWQTAYQVRNFLVQLRNDANEHNRDHVVTFKAEAESWCLMTTAVSSCQAGGLLVLKPLWPDIALIELTPSLAFYGLKDTAWAGRICLRSPAGEWTIIVSNAGRIRMCNGSGGQVCR